MMYQDVDVFGIIAAASNIRRGENPKYTSETFLAAYPQFGAANPNGERLVPDVMIQAWVSLAHAAIQKARYREYWEAAMGLFIAHWLTLYLQGRSPGASSSAESIVNAGLAKGVQTSKSAGDLSVSYDFSQVAGDFTGWGTYKLTIYGQQFVTIARLVSLGGMTVW